MTEETAEKPTNQPFQAEVAELLKLMVHSVYSETDIFLRELISNASDACDKLRYAAITEPELTAGDPEFKVTLEIDKKAKRITLTDNGIGITLLNAGGRITGNEISQGDAGIMVSGGSSEGSAPELSANRIDVAFNGLVLDDTTQAIVEGNDICGGEQSLVMPENASAQLGENTFC